MAAQFAAGGAVIPFITLLFRDRGLSLGEISLIFTSSSATMLAAPLLWGMLADRLMPVNRVLGLLNLLAGASLAFLAGQQHFRGLLIGYTCYFACFNPSLYLLNALSFQHLRSPRDQFGFLRAWGSFGWIVPFLPIALWLARTGLGELDFVIYLGVVCCAAMAVLSFWLPHTPPAGGSPTADGAARFHSAQLYARGVSRLLLNREYMVLLSSMILVAGSFSLLTYYSPPVLQEAGVPRAWIGPVQAIAVLFEIVLFQWQPALLRRWNYTGIALAGCVALAVRHLMFATTANLVLLAASYLLAGAVIVLYHQGVSLLVNAIATNEVRATAQTLLLLCGQGLGPLFANGVTMRLTGHSQGLRPVFLFAAALAGVAACLIASRGRQLNAAGRE